MASDKYVETMCKNISEQNQKYRQECKEYRDNWRKKNIDYIRHYQREYEKKPERKEYKKLNRQQPITCECGCVVNRGNMRKHLKSKKHEDLINPVESVEVVKSPERDYIPYIR